MLIEFSVKNFRSIKERQTLSLVSTPNEELKKTNTTSILDDKLSLVSSVAIYGPNASGKSNLLKALQTMERIILHSAEKGQRGTDLSITPYLFDNANREEPTEFEISFISQNVRYQYGFSATKKQVFDEWLLAYPKGRSQTWIDRKWNPGTQEHEWGASEKLRGPKHLWQNSTRPNALFLSTAIQLNNKQLQPIFDWFQSTIRLLVAPFTIGQNFTLEYCEEEHQKAQVIEFLRKADFAINDLNIRQEEVDLDKFLEDAPRGLAEQLRDTVTESDSIKIQQYDVQTVHIGMNGERYELDLDEESEGTQKFLSFAGPWLDVLQNGYVLVVDELHSNLHPSMVKFMVQMFHNKTLNKKGAQLLFTTHEISILSQEVFRRDQIWFTEKDEFNATTLYPLSDFSPRKGVENLEKNYLQGRYGALPYLQEVVNLFGEPQ